MKHIYQDIFGWFTFADLYGAIVQSSHGPQHFVEVGAFLGKSAAYMAVEIANSGKPIKFDVVDTWKGHDETHDWLELLKQPEFKDHDPRLVTRDMFDVFMENMAPVKHMFTPVRMASAEAAATYPDKSLDFVFIDASHVYEDVLADMRAWYPKVKDGGVLAGHDYDEGWPGVQQAVNEFLASIGSKPTLVNEQKCWFLYWKRPAGVLIGAA